MSLEYENIRLLQKQHCLNEQRLLYADYMYTVICDVYWNGERGYQ